MIERYSGEYIDEPSIKVGFDPSIGYLADRNKIAQIIQGWDEQYHIDIEDLRKSLSYSVFQSHDRRREIVRLKKEIKWLKEENEAQKMYSEHCWQCTEREEEEARKDSDGIRVPELS